MKTTVLTFLVASTCVVGQASADFIELGSSYFIAPGASYSQGFLQAGGPFADSIYDHEFDVIGPDLSGNGLIVSSETLTDNGGGNFDLVFRVATTVGGNILPEGVLVSDGFELISLGLFVGGGTNPVDVVEPIIANTALIEVFNTEDESIGTIDVIGSSNFVAGPGGGWDGSFGLNFGSAIEIGDVGAIELQINFDAQAVPEPTSGLMGVILLGLVATRCRRR